MFHFILVFSLKLKLKSHVSCEHNTFCLGIQDEGHKLHMRSVSVLLASGQSVDIANEPQ